MTHKNWDREPDDIIVPPADAHVFIEAQCIYCTLSDHDVSTGVNETCDNRVGNEDVPRSWSFGPEGNDMADYEDERGRFYVDQGDWDIRDYWTDHEESVRADSPWRQQ